MAGALTNYPTGYNRPPQTESGQPRFQTHSGAVFWVSNSTAITRNQSPGSDSAKGDFNHPFATLNYALTQCVAGRGDIVFVKPNHIETLGGIGVITQSAAGTSVIGLGNYNSKPKFLMGTAATTTYLISGANCYVGNLWMVGNFSNVTTCFAVTGVGAHIDNIRFTNAGTNLDFLTCITASGAANTADGLMVTNCNWTTIDTDDLGMINFVNAAADVVVWNNQMVTTAANSTAGSISGLINVQTGNVLTNADIGWNRLQNLISANEVFMSTVGTTYTGFVHNNYIMAPDIGNAIDTGADVTGFGLFNNLTVTTNVLSGFVNPAADVNN